MNKISSVHDECIKECGNLTGHSSGMCQACRTETKLPKRKHVRSPNSKKRGVKPSV